MYLRKIRPRTTCLYSAASMLLRSLSAASQRLASKPTLAELFVDGLLDLERAIRESEKLAAILFSGEGKKRAALSRIRRHLVQWVQTITIAAVSSSQYWSRRRRHCSFNT